MTLNSDFEGAIDALENGKEHLFITGKAGVGKSTLLQHFRANTKKNLVVLAPTGVAALNVQGQTIHSFFGFPAHPLTRKDIKRRYITKLYERLDLIIIDEISMVRADLLDSIDWFLRLNRGNEKPFGGVKMAFFGDLFQLPPIVATDEERLLFVKEYKSPYFFSAKVFKETNLVLYELRQVFRQTDRKFLRLLDEIRLNQMDEDTLEDLNDRHIPNFKNEEKIITLCARNATADALNQSCLQAIPTNEFRYVGYSEGQFNPTILPAEQVLILRVGAQVMFVKNDGDRRFVNGTIGTVCGLDNDSIEVVTLDGTKVLVEKAKWETHRYILNEKGELDTELLGSYTQYPLRLAWGITIHKSQGKTFDKILIDLGKGAFEHGQTYVALSRCRTLEGIVLKQKITPSDIRTDERIVDYYETNS